MSAGFQATGQTNRAAAHNQYIVPSIVFHRYLIDIAIKNRCSTCKTPLFSSNQPKKIALLWAYFRQTP
jgi:hypothetical protein